MMVSRSAHKRDTTYEEGPPQTGKPKTACGSYKDTKHVTCFVQTRATSHTLDTQPKSLYALCCIARKEKARRKAGKNA